MSSSPPEATAPNASAWGLACNTGLQGWGLIIQIRPTYNILLALWGVLDMVKTVHSPRVGKNPHFRRENHTVVEAVE